VYSAQLQLHIHSPPYLILYTNTDIVPQPQITASCINLCIPRAKLLKGDPRSCIDRPAAVTTLNQVEGLAVVDNARHLRRGTGGLSWFGGLRCGCCARDVNTDMVVQPEV
jgi:hypothetical protein